MSSYFLHGSRGFNANMTICLPAVVLYVETPRRIKAKCGGISTAKAMIYSINATTVQLACLLAI
jgi:hypothetical protein